MSPPYLTEILFTRTPEQFQSAVRRAADLLRAGQTVALPTETVYGLAANALDAQAVARIYQVKGRPAHNPIIVHVADLEGARRCARHWPEAADRLAAAFWPGPLTLVLPRADNIPDLVTAQGDTVGLRWPSHPFIQAVIRECGFPLAAPSANLSNQVSPTTAEHVRSHLDGRIPLIVDGGPSSVGIESTVFDLASDPHRVLRPGMIHEESLRAVLASLPTAPAPASADKTQSLRSPGLLAKHYAPRARLLVRAWEDEADLLAQIARLPATAKECFILAHTRLPDPSAYAGVSVLPHQAAAFAQLLYAELHEADASTARWILVEAPPPTSEWRGIRDRLVRAST